MRTRKLGKSDLEVPVIAYGAWAIGGWMWGGADEDQAVRALHAAFDQGMSLVDTAPVYGMGHSETIVGKALAGFRDKVHIATKCGIRWDCDDGVLHYETRDNNGVPLSLYRNLRPLSVRYECEQSLKRLRVDYIDLYQCHWPDPTTPISDTMEILEELRSEGKIRVYGVSNFTVEQMADCLVYGRIESNQPRYSALDRHVEEEILPFCRQHSLGVLAYSPLEQGLLTGKVGLDRNFVESDQRHTKPLFSRENRVKILKMLDVLRPMAEKYNATFTQFFLAWLTAQEGVTAALAGARSEAQVLENAAAGDLQLSPEDCAAIRRVVESVDVIR